MPTVNTSVWIDAPLAVAYEVAKDNSAFPEFMKDVRSVTIIDQSQGAVVSDWVGVITAFNIKVRWRQEDVWDDQAHTCTFRQLEGDYDALSGVWTFQEENGGVRFDSVVDYSFVVPGLGPLVQKVVHSLVIKNMDGVLGAIKERSELKARA